MNTPHTLGDYRDICVTLGGETCEAVKFLDRWIARQGRGRDEPVMADALQMMLLLVPLFKGEAP